MLFNQPQNLIHSAQSLELIPEGLSLELLHAEKVFFDCSGEWTHEPLVSRRVRNAENTICWCVYKYFFKAEKWLVEAEALIVTQYHY